MEFDFESFSGAEERLSRGARSDRCAARQAERRWIAVLERYAAFVGAITRCEAERHPLIIRQ